VEKVFIWGEKAMLRDRKDAKSAEKNQIEIFFSAFSVFSVSLHTLCSHLDSTQSVQLADEISSERAHEC
jgi:hypothetical protein